MLLKIIDTTDNQYIGQYVEYNEVGKILTLPTGKSVEILEEIIEGNEYTLINSNYIIKLITTT